MPTMQEPSKPAVLMVLRRRSDSVYVRLDARVTGVQLPHHLLGQEAVILQVVVPANAPFPITDLQLTAHCLSCTLSFHGKPFFCVVPWTAVEIIADGEGKGQAWEKSAQSIIDSQWAKRAAPPVGGSTPHPSERSYLRRVK
jgi:stringent starvation protein B